MWIIYALLSAVFAGTCAIFAKVGLSKISSDLVNVYRTLVVLIFAWLMVLVTGAFSDFAKLDLVSLSLIILSGLATGVSWFAYYKALSLANVYQVAVIDKSSVIISMLLGFIILSEPISVLKFICMLLIGLGTFLTIDHKNTNFSLNKQGLFLAFISALFASLASLFAKFGLSELNSNLATALRTIVILVMALLLLKYKRVFLSLKDVDKKAFRFIIYSGLATGMSWLCYFKALQDGLLSVVLPIDKLSIVVTFLLSYYLLHEKVSKKALSGFVVLVIGTLLLLV